MKAFAYDNLTPTGSINRDRRCPHCGNNGYVYLDNGQDANRAAPCPACRIGAIKNAQHGYWQHANINGVTWDGGKTLDHRRCDECSRVLETRVLIPPGPCRACAARRTKTA